MSNRVSVFPKQKSQIQNILIYELFTFYNNKLHCLQVVVKGTVDSSDVVVISLNQPASRVEEKISGVER